MITKLDHLIISVNDITEAEKKFTSLFGIDPVWRGEHSGLGTVNCIFNFKNTYLELLAAKGEGLGGRLGKKNNCGKRRGIDRIGFRR
tara:strand:- start:226 stop:486 length:261 start_codon:yes stop_codon:yes gene_type:complete